jgi:hypothetical protein
MILTTFLSKQTAGLKVIYYHQILIKPIFYS